MEDLLRQSTQEAEEQANLPCPPPLPAWAPDTTPVEGMMLCQVAQIMADQGLAQPASPSPPPAPVQPRRRQRHEEQIAWQVPDLPWEAPILIDLTKGDDKSDIDDE
jgi:hypothetical protein